MRRSSFASAIKKRMKEKNIGVRELSRLTGIDAGFLSKIINDQRPPPSEEKISKISKALGMRESVLLIKAKMVPKELVEGILKALDVDRLEQFKNFSKKDKQNFIRVLEMGFEAVRDSEKGLGFILTPIN